MGPQVAEDVRTLGGLAAHMRRRRFASGALRLDNVKLVFQLGEDGNPASAEPHGTLPGRVPVFLLSVSLRCGPRTSVGVLLSRSLTWCQSRHHARALRWRDMVLSE